MYMERVSCGRGNLYYQGEQVTMRITGTEVVDLDKVDFVIALCNADYCFKRQKAECQQVDENKYTCVISGEESKEIPAGTYDIEVLLAGEESKHIAVAHNAVVIAKSCFCDD